MRKPWAIGMFGITLLPKIPSKDGLGTTCIIETDGPLQENIAVGACVG